MSYAKTSLRADKHALREKMRAMALDHRQIAAEFARQYQLRPRAALREAYGWSLKEAAERINAFRGDAGLDPRGSAAMTGAHLSEHENWPGHGAEPSGRKPTPYLLALLAAVYGCAVSDLVDLADREHLPPADLLILDKYRQDQPRFADIPPADERVCQRPARGNEPALRGGEDRYAVLEMRGTHAHLAPRPAALAVPLSPGVAYRWIQEPDLGGFWNEREVLMTAHEGSDPAERAEAREIGDATLEQLRAEVTQLSRDYMAGEPLLMFRDMRRVRLRRSISPRHAPRGLTALRQLNPAERVSSVAALGLSPPITTRRLEQHPVSQNTRPGACHEARPHVQVVAAANRSTHRISTASDWSAASGGSACLPTAGSTTLGDQLANDRHRG
jgi:transcriptional regulator with XRE-family HTH domain